MNEQKIIGSLIQSRDSYQKLAPALSDEDFSTEGALLVSSISEYYDRDPEAKEVDPDLLFARIERKLSNPKHVQVFKQIIQNTAQVSTPNVVEEFLALRRKNAGLRLAQALSEGTNENRIHSLMEEYNRFSIQEEGTGSDDETFQGHDLSDLMEDLKPDNLIKILPMALNRRLEGGAQRGHHILVTARPDMGKTATVINMMRGFVHPKQGLKVMYCGNEDPIKQILLRTVSSLSGMPKMEVFKEPQRAQEEARKAGYDNIIFKSLSPGTFREIRSAVSQFKPDVVIIDQLRNMHVGTDNMVERLERAAIQARNLAKSENVLVVSVTQAGDSATGKAILSMSDIDSSKTGLPGQVDLQVGVGATEDQKANGLRTLSIGKNKLSGDHGYFTVRINEQLSRISSLE